MICEILKLLREKPEIDYEKCSSLLFKLTTAVCRHYQQAHGENGLRNVVMMYKREIAEKIYRQMMQHFYCENGFLTEEVIGVTTTNMTNNYTFTSRQSIFQNYTGDALQHKQYYKAMNLIRKQNKVLFYLNGTNTAENVVKMYEDLCK